MAALTCEQGRRRWGVLASARERRWSGDDEVAEHSSDEAAPGMGTGVVGSGRRGIWPLPDLVE